MTAPARRRRPAPNAPAGRASGDGGTGAGLHPLVVAAALSLLGLFLVVSLTPLTNNDIWLHMANGRWILQHGSVPLTDPYSFSAEGARFYAHEWLAGVVFHLVHRVGGVAGLILFKTLLGGLALLAGVWLARRLRSGWTAVLGCGAAVLVIVNSRFLERPEMFSYALTALYVWVAALEYRKLAADGDEAVFHRRVGGSLLWWLVPVQWLWVQLHGYFLTGIALLGLFLTAAWVDRLRDVRTAPGSLSATLRALATPRLLSGSLAGVAAILVGFINPNGYEIYTFPFELSGSIFTETIFEWKPTFMTSSITRSSMFVAFCLWLGLLVISCLDLPSLLRRTGPWRALSVGGLFALLLVRAGLPGPPADGALPESSWLWSPGDLLLSLTDSATLAAVADGVVAPLRVIHRTGPELFTLLWLGLALLVVLRWKRPVDAALTVLPVTVGFILFDAQRAFDAGLAGGSSLSRALYGAAPASVRDVGTAAVVFLLLTVAPALVAAGWSRRWPLWQVLVTAFFLYMALKQNRNIVNFALVTFPFVAAGLTRTAAAARSPGEAAPRRPRIPGLALLAASLAALIALTLFAGWPYTSRVVKKVGLGVGPRIPAAAVDYIRANGIRGRAFNKYAYGAYLIHELYPDTRVFMDSRNDVYGPELYRTYLRALDRPEVTASVFQQYDFDYVLVDYRFFPARSPDRALLDYLHERPEWVLVYFDHTSLLYVRNRRQHAALIVRDGYRAIDPVRYRPGVVAALDPVGLDAWETESRRALQQSPEAVPALLMRIDVLSATGRESEAMPLIDRVLTSEPASIVALVAGARIARRIGDFPRARELYRRALGLRPGLEEIRLELEALEGVEG